MSRLDLKLRPAILLRLDSEIANYMLTHYMTPGQTLGLSAQDMRDFQATPEGRGLLPSSMYRGFELVVLPD